MKERRSRTSKGGLQKAITSSSHSLIYSTNELPSLSSRPPHSSDEATESFYKNLLCVQTDNSGTKGIFFDTGTTHTALYPSAADAFKSPPDCMTDYNYICYEKSAVTGRKNDDNYVYGDFLPAIQIPTSTTAVTAFGGSLPLPSADSHGVCSEVRRRRGEAYSSARSRYSFTK